MLALGPITRFNIIWDHFENLQVLYDDSIGVGVVVDSKVPAFLCNAYVICDGLGFKIRWSEKFLPE